MTDDRIVQLLWQREEDGLQMAEATYGAMCRGIARNILKNEEDVLECVNDTWHGLWNAIPPERPHKLKAYIARITRNLAMKRLRERNAGKRQAVTVSYEELSQCISAHGTPQQMLEGKELSRAIDAFLDKLSEKDRNLFLRRYWFFDSIQVLSQSFHMTQSNVKVRLHRIREQLKEYLAKEVDVHVG